MRLCSPSRACARRAEDGCGAKDRHAARHAAAKKPADCKTEITRAQFEKIAAAVSPAPNVTPQLKRQLAAALPPDYRDVGSSESEGTRQDSADSGDDEVRQDAGSERRNCNAPCRKRRTKFLRKRSTEYYKNNPEAYEQFSLDRLFVPRFKQADGGERRNRGKSQRS